MDDWGLSGAEWVGRFLVEFVRINPKLYLGHEQCTGGGAVVGVGGGVDGCGLRREEGAVGAGVGGGFAGLGLVSWQGLEKQERGEGGIRAGLMLSL